MLAWNRETLVTVGQVNTLGRAWSGALHTTFTVDKDLQGEPNTATVELYNLNEESRSWLEQEDARLVLEAGYQTRPTLFIGDVERVEHEHTGEDWISRLECDDGGRVYQNTHVSLFHGPGVSALLLFREITEAMGVPLRLEAAPADVGALNDVWLTGYSVHAPARRALAQVAEAAGFQWSIQNGVVQILPLEGATFEPAVLVSPTTGLVGRARRAKIDVGGSRNEQQRDGVEFASLLTYVFDPGQRVRVESADVTGTFVVHRVTYSGDSYGGDFYATVEAVSQNQ